MKKRIGIACAFLFSSLSFAISPALSYKKDFHFKNWGLSFVQAPQAWTLEKGSPQMVVAVVDTGIDSTHPDLKGTLWHGSWPRELSQLMNHFFFGWDFVLHKPNPSDFHGHGTHVAGIIAAKTNMKSGTSGIAPGVRLMAVRYYSQNNSGIQNLRNTVQALKFAIQHGARIINYSGGGPEFSSEEFQALQLAEKKGILVVCAAGNEGKNTDKEKNYYFPAAYQHYGLKNIISVASVDPYGKLIPSSNWGKNSVDIAAPGSHILSTIPGGQYSTMTGTSQATAFVSGAVALIWSHNPHLTAQEVKNILLSSVKRLPSLAGKIRSEGILQVFEALKKTNQKNTILVQQQSAAASF